MVNNIMFVGTGSDVGKSIIAAAFCRILLQDGYHPAPFKAQNMALNSFATPEGTEIGRAQAVQAEAAGLPCETDMNPLLLKPQSDHTSQVILNGRPVGNYSARDYFSEADAPRPHKRLGREELRREVCAAYDRLAAKYKPIVIEGAGSISEINLRDSDIVNLPMAAHANADVFLVGDIDRGGVFASVYGSLELLRPYERKLIKGIIINKFRGDIRLFEKGVKMMEELCQLPVLGVIPYFTDIHIEEEDSVSLATKAMQARMGKVNIAVVLLRHISNFTDFNTLERDPRIHLFYTNNVSELNNADIIILPGSKSTIDDLSELRRNGAASAILQAHRKRTTIIGICGGYQMMGMEIADPLHIEGDTERIPGLGLLPVTTCLSKEKVTRQTRFSRDGTWMEGYEIHNGTTVPVEGACLSPLFHKEDGAADGYIADGKCMGTYIHGAFDNKPFIDYLLKPFSEDKGVGIGSQAQAATHPAPTYNQFKEEQYDKLASHVRANINMPLFYKIIGNHG